MDRLALLAAKQMEIKQHLAQWALEKGILNDGEFLFFSLAVGLTKDTVLATIQEPDESKSGSTDELDDNDWEFLLTCSWENDVMGKVIALFRERGNIPMGPSQIGTVLNVDLTKVLGKNPALRMKNAVRDRATGGKWNYHFSLVDRSSGISLENRRRKFQKTPLVK